MLPSASVTVADCLTPPLDAYPCVPPAPGSIVKGTASSSITGPEPTRVA